MKKLKLTNLENNNLSEKEMNNLRGGNACGCGCKYEGTPGGSTIEANGQANSDGGIWPSDAPGFITPIKVIGHPSKKTDI
ncbi:MAG: TIGR04149 family rSAM-modified RiPP [Bacteroidales bacterium]|jgi:natural product precursor|nr:TIGR04149 family rSAM-modified RiPP [Bacteroidales bacterium]